MLIYNMIIMDVDDCDVIVMMVVFVMMSFFVVDEERQ